MHSMCVQVCVCVFVSELCVACIDVIHSIHSPGGLLWLQVKLSNKFAEALKGCKLSTHTHAHVCVTVSQTEL